MVDIVLPRAVGGNGADGQNATIAIGTVTTLAPGASATVTNAGTPTSAVLDFGLPTGPAGTNGTNGTSATIAVGSVTTGVPGSSATVTNVGTPLAAVFDFSIPRGSDGTGSPTTVAQFRAGSGSGYVTPAIGASAVAFVTITRTSAAGGLDFATFINASITLDANLTVSGWINNYPGATGIIRFKQDGTGGRTVAWASGYIVPAGFSLQATANGVTDVPYICEADNKIRLYNPSKWTA